MSTPTAARAVIYCRISRDEVGRALGVQRQEGHCRELVERHGWRLVDVIVDNNVSAYREKRRPGYLAMLDLVKNGDADVIVVWHPDRLHRSVRELEDFIDLLNVTGATVSTVTAGEVDLETPEGRLMARIQGAVARKESEDKSRRIRDKQLELARDGKISGGGRRPYGYASDRRTVIEAEAAVIREAAERVLAGASLRSVCADLTERGVPSAQGGPWLSQVLKPILTSGRIAGQREHHGHIVAQAEWPAIITSTKSTQLRRVLNDPARRKLRPARRYLLSGLVRCVRCEKVMVSRPKTNGTRGYACQSGPPWYGCGRMFIQAERLERIVEAALIEALEGGAVQRRLVVRAAGTAVDAEAAEAEISECDAQLEELAHAYGSKVVGMAEWLAARRPIEARKKAAEEVQALHTGADAVVRLLRPGAGAGARFLALDIERKRAVAAALVEYVPISPHDRSRGREFQDDRIGDPKWWA